MQWIIENWLILSGLVVAVLGVAKIAVKLTATPKDDAVVAEVDKVVNRVLGKSDAPKPPQA